MIIRPQLSNIKNIGYYLGRIILGIGLTMFLPFACGLVLFREINPALDFLISASFAVLIGLGLSWSCKTDTDLEIGEAMVVIALSWLFAMALGAMPLFLSGHYKSFLDACFEAMSGFTTTGLTLVQDLDHLAWTHNLWRHLGPFIGGQGIAVIAISFLVSGAGGSLNLYFGEARDEKLVPNVIHTARFIWLISLAYLVLGTIILGLAGMYLIGLKPGSAFFHAACIFMAGFDTAGFAPQSPNILYYHSMIFELVIIVFMIMGSLNFNLHYQIWTGNVKEIWKNIETRTFLFAIMALSLLIITSLKHFGGYSQGMILFRKGFFQVISGQTTTGYMTIYAQQFIREWGDLALIGMIIAMAMGGSACSTAGGIKMLRLGIIAKALILEVKKILSPNAIIAEKVHHIRTIFLEDRQVWAVLMVTLGYLLLCGLGTLVGVALGYPLLDALFESTSAAGNVGLSCGITDAGMPGLLKVTYIIEMWAGRLELISVFALIGFFVALVKGK